MSLSLDCAEVEKWQALPDEDLPEEQLRQVERHLESCTACQERLDRDEACGASIRKILRNVGDPTTGPADPTLLHVMDRLCGVRSPAPGSTDDSPDLYFLRPSERPDGLGLLGNYEVLEVIGQGGMGLVLKAVDPGLHRYVAIKVLAPALAGSATARQRFTREAQAAAAVSHDHVVVVHGVYETDGLPYLVMEYVPGESLQERIDRCGPLELIEIARIGLQTASGLAAAHAQGLIHRDIKPANLLLENGLARVTITDFGLARAVDDVQLTQHGVVAGTPEYMSPEQACGNAIDHRADLFSLGSVLYAMATGLPPFRGSTSLAVLRHVSDEIPVPIRALNPNVPAWLETLVERLMAKAPDQRIQTAAEVAALLEGYLAHLRQPATSPAPPIPAAPGDDRRRRTPGAWRDALQRSMVRFCVPALLVAVGVAALFWFPWAGGGPPQKAAPNQGYVRSLKSNSNLEGLVLEGPDAQECVHFEPEGMRIQLPLGYAGTRPSAGLTITQAVKGDFEITVHFEILGEAATVEPGERLDGPLTRFTLDAGADRAKGTVATLSRRRDPKRGPEFFTWVSWWKETAGKTQTQARSRPSSAKTGRFRLARVGAMVAYYAAEGAEGPFILLNQVPFTADDLENVRILASTGGAQAALDVRFSDLLIQAKGLASLPAAPASDASAPPSGGTRTNLAISLALLVVLSLAFALWLLVGRRRGKVSAATAAAAPAGPGPSSPVAAIVAFGCPACKKMLHARAELTGKKVRCPGCGQPALVPALAPREPAPAPVVKKRGFALPAKYWLVAAPVLLAALLLGGWGLWFSRHERPSLLNVTLGNTPVADVEEAGFYEQEFDQHGAAFRWTNGHAKLVIAIDKNKPPQALALEIFVFRPPGQQCRLQILANRKELFHGDVRHWKWQKTFALTGMDLGQELVLEIVSDTLVPQGLMDGGANTDARALGVQVRAVKLLPAPDEEDRAAPAAQLEEGVVELLEDKTTFFIDNLHNQGVADASTVERNEQTYFSGNASLAVTEFQRFNGQLPGWNFAIAEHPEPGQFRYLRFAWKRSEAPGIMLQLHAPGAWHRYYAGSVTDATRAWGAMTRVADDPPREWSLVTRDLFQDFGPMRLSGIGFSALEGPGYAYFDHIYLGRSIEDLDRVTARLKKVVDLPDSGSWVGQHWIAWLAVTAGAIVVGVWFFVRPRRGDGSAQAGTPPPAEARHQQPPGAVVSFRCPACKKELKARPELAGKKVKCPSCRQAASVPAPG